MTSATAGIATIDGRSIEISSGETILEAATRNSVDIPTLCHSPGLTPEGGCRVCMVEVEGQRPLAACHTPIAVGMRIRTTSERLTRIRHDVLALSLGTCPPGAAVPRPDGTRFERLLHEHGVTSAPFGPRGSTAAVDESHPYLRFDRDRCITCRICLHACEEIQGQFVYGVEGRGAQVRLVYGGGDRLVDSPCVACGACVDRCPTGALFDRDRTQAAGLAGARPERVIESVCGYCGVGCRDRIESSGNAVLRIGGVDRAEVNHGHLCVKGRYAHAYQGSPERLTTPLIREGGTLRPAAWDEAIHAIAERLTAIRDRHGPEALGALTSSRSTNESAYLLQKLFRSLIGTNNVDCCARVCHSSTAVALAAVTGTGAATASYADIEAAALIVVAGSNPTEAHPVVGARIKQAALDGAALLVIDPRRIELAEYATMHLQHWPGTNVALFNAIAKALVEEDLVAHDYVRDRCEGFDELRALLDRLSMADLAAITRVSERAIRDAARLLARRGPGLFVSGLGLSEQTQGVLGVAAYCSLGLLTGALGRRGAGMLPLRGQNNVQGNADMGSQPYALTGYHRLDDDEARTRFARAWGVAPPRGIGLTIPEMYDAAVAGSLRCLWIQGEDVVQSDPHHVHVVQALSSLEFLVVQELFLTETARHAHVVLPAASVLEQEGTFTNGERRIQRVRPAVPAPGAARRDWEAVRDVARAMGGLGTAWRYRHPGDVMDEIAAVAPGLFGGVRYDRLEGDGLQWPCPTAEHPGTSSVHADGFVRGKARFLVADYRPPLDALDASFPFLLITGRVLDHYNVGTMTRRTPSSSLVDADYLEMHPHDAERLGLPEGSRVTIRSRWGTTTAPLRHSRRMLAGTAFLPFHFPETNTNCLVGPHVDPTSKCPDYKVVAVSFGAASLDS